MGKIVYFYLEVFNHSTEYSHTNGIKQIFLDANGTQLCFVDEKHDLYIYDPINENVIPVPDAPDSAEGVIWDQNIYERSIFAVYNKNFIATYVFVKYHVDGNSIPFPLESLCSQKLMIKFFQNIFPILFVPGPKVLKVSSTKLPSESIPVLMYSGEITLGTVGGKLIKITLTSHDEVGNIVDNKKIVEILEHQILCRR